MMPVAEHSGARFAGIVRAVIVAFILAAIAIGFFATANAIMARQAALLKHLADRQTSIAQLEERLTHELSSLRDRLAVIGAERGELEQLNDPGHARQMLSEQQQSYSSAIADHSVAVSTPAAAVETPLNNKLSVYTATIIISGAPERVLTLLSTVDTAGLVVKDVLLSSSAGANRQTLLTATLTLQKIGARTPTVEGGDA